MISIIIPSLNSPHIKKIVEVLKKEKSRFKDMEILVVGKDQAGLLSGEEEIIFVDTGKSLSPARSRNIGLKRAAGKEIIFLDSDCLPKNGWLYHLVKAHSQGKKVVGGAMDFNGGNFWQFSDNIIHFYNSHPSRRGEIMKDGPLPTANLSISREALNEVGLFSEELVTGEDFEYSMKLRAKGYTLYFERQAVVTHLTSRRNLKEILIHSRSWAKNSIYLRKKFRSYLNTPFFMEHSLLVYLSSPLLAGLATFKVFFTSTALCRYWYIAPVIYLAKLIWSLTAAQELSDAR